MNRDSDNRITAFAQTNFRNHRKPFGIKRADRRSGMYIIGKTGTGKSTLMETMIRQDIKDGEGVALLDPHGDLVERIARSIPDHRKKDLIYFNVPDFSNPLGFNPCQVCRRRNDPARLRDYSMFSRKSGVTPGDRAWNTCSAMHYS